MLSSHDVARSILAQLDKRDDGDNAPGSASPHIGIDSHFPRPDECPSTANPKLASLGLRDVQPTSIPFATDVADRAQQHARQRSPKDAAACLAHLHASETEVGWRQRRGYMAIEDYAIIGNMRTCALVATDASIDYMCWPKFDSPSLFCRLLDAEKGGYWSIEPKMPTSTKQQYLPNSNVLVTRFMGETGAAQVTDFMHVPDTPADTGPVSQHSAPGATWYATPLVSGSSKPQYPWVIRVLEAVRGRVEFDVTVHPAFNYALSPHTVTVLAPTATGKHAPPSSAESNEIVVFATADLAMDLRTAAYEECSETGCGAPLPRIQWERVEDECMRHLGPGARATITLSEGQQVWFVFRERPGSLAKDTAFLAANGVIPEAAILSADCGKHTQEQAHPPVIVQPCPEHPLPGTTQAPCIAARKLAARLLSPENSETGRPGSRFAMDRHGVLGGTPSNENEGGDDGGRARMSPVSTESDLSSSSPPFSDKPRSPRARTYGAEGAVAAGGSALGLALDTSAPPTIGLSSDGTTDMSGIMPLDRSLPNGHLALNSSTDSNVRERRTSSLDLLDPSLNIPLLQSLLRQTLRYWSRWISGCTYQGRWREVVQRSALALKLLTYQPTGAVIAAATFSLPEEVCGNRTWDYRLVWVRDAAFVVYAFLRLGLVSEARSFMRFIELIIKDRNEDGSLQVMYTIEGNRDILELELAHLSGYKGSRPVRIGNAASTHLQLDIYGALLDSIYLMNRMSSPIGYDLWCVCRELVDYVVKNWRQPDQSIWEVRGRPQNFVYSKVMCWVAIDRGLRLSEKRVLPCPHRSEWCAARDEIYEEIQERGWNAAGGFFQMSYETPILDASVLIMPLVFFISPTDPRMLSTIAAILRPPEQGGLTSSGQVYRYIATSTDDGIEGGEGSFTMCTFWMVEALTRAGKYIDKHRARALYAFEQTLAFGNHLGLFSEEVSPAGELTGNFPQAFTHIALISSAFNLDRVLGHRSGELV